MHDTALTLITWPNQDLTPSELAEVLGVARQSITEAIKGNRIEALTYNLRGRRREVGRHRISKSAALRWLWTNTTGDRAALRATLAEHAPALLRTLEQSTSPKPAPKVKAAAWHPDQLDLFAAP